MQAGDLGEELESQCATGIVPGIWKCLLMVLMVEKEANMRQVGLSSKGCLGCDSLPTPCSWHL